MSEHDPIDELPQDLRAMLDLARAPDVLPPETADRMLRALDARVIAEASAPPSGTTARAPRRRGPLSRAPWKTLGGFVAGLILGAVGYHFARPPATRVVVRERVVTQERVVTRERVVAPATPPVAAPATPPERGDDASDLVAPQRHRSHDERDDLAAEQRLIDAARLSLRAGDTAAALDRLGQHGRRFRRGQLAPERELLRVRALVRAGRRAEAEAIAARFRARHPRHALIPALEAALR